MTIIIPEEPGLPSSAEIDIMRINTKMFIDADPVSLVLMRHPRTRSDDGGWQNGVPAQVPAQRFRLIPQADVAPSVQTPDGVQLLPGYVLMGEYNSDMHRWDTFSLGTIDYVITSPIRPEFRAEEFIYELKADVARI